MACSLPLKETCAQLVPAFEQSSGHSVTTIWASTRAIVERIDRGEVVDIVVMNAPSIDRLIARGKLMADTRVDIARSGIGMATRAGAGKVDVSSVDALKQTLAAANSIAISSGMSGTYVAGLLRDWGVADRLQARLRQVAPGVPVGEVVARGEAAIGFQQISELLPVAGIDYLGPLPPEVQHFTVFSAALHTDTLVAEPATALVRFLTSPAAIPIIARWGMEPAWQ